MYGEGKKKTVNEEAAKLLEKYRVPIEGRQVSLSIRSELTPCFL